MDHLCPGCSSFLPHDPSVTKVVNSSFNSEILSSNHTLTEAESSKIQVSVSQTEAWLDHIDAQMNDLSEARCKLVEYCLKQKAVLAPVRRLSDDVLAEIFLHGIAEPWQSNIMTNLKALPWAVGQVCSRWRLVSLSTPHLWSSLSISVGKRHITGLLVPPSDGPRLIDIPGLLAECLTRSGSIPLTIKFHGEKEAEAAHAAGTLPTAADVLRLLIPHSQRWKDLDIRLSDETCMNLLAEAASHMSVLERLCFDNPERLDLHVLQNTFTVAPSLVEVELSQNSTSLAEFLPVSQLHTIQFGETLDRTAHFLERATELLHLTVIPSGRPLPRIITLPRLQSISCGDACLSSLILPSLQNLDYSSNPWGNRTQVLLNFLTRSSRSLNSLMLSSYEHFNMGYIDVFRSHSSLVWLKIWFDERWSPVMSQIAGTGDSAEGSVGILLPALRHLVLTCNVEFLPNVLTMVESRLALPRVNTAPLRSLRLNVNCHHVADGSEYAARIDAIRQSGLSVKESYYGRVN